MLCMVMVFGIMEDEQIFSNVAFIKTKLGNHLNMYLYLVAQMYIQKFYTLETICTNRNVKMHHITNDMLDTSFHNCLFTK
jgi:hypothetical protein